MLKKVIAKVGFAFSLKGTVVAFEGAQSTSAITSGSSRTDARVTVGC